ncbi:methyl-accepting chemotaxis protein [Pseudomonas savastanoi pv. phaseolicola]|uniref:Methyl-accepting chemotaxis protein n=3 Tax=Pseudomonas savastanoi TaxID=29438 RepID=A0A3M4NB72_PSESG|nr:MULTISPECIES: methyl-accepting chemotaxis protein [Pseudomonas]AAZ34451.1 methyl-accepting chemotaxis protein [Pseudomonas savastanoi pv. phaseolicola 1448A]KPB45459.1 Methyl-accepting chemotaxis protein [Pseudomonas savastanoi pv. phaseolicola]KPB45836.1 Methyl-accepting chemotaxis protein [Pseudomonas savastanoi pv. phaseolicola]KPB65122.1 Methyl-accepting chemotaxis protein [Pseudomonas savastanoi pv. phaseolicola]KPB65513.1 Methyl-accepting chemotaxis protein [Pseudomonas amygdali pv. m
MNWFYNAKLSTKLFISFALCAVITLAVGMVASRGIGELASNLKLAFSNNLVSVSKTNEATINVVEQNRDLYRLLSVTASNAPQSVKDEVLDSMKNNRAEAEKAYATYRATPLEDDERAAGDKMDKDWPVYQTLVDRAVAVVFSGDVAAARALIEGDVRKAYLTVVDELYIMVGSNNRQIGEGAIAAEKTESAANLNLYMGIGIAFVAAFLLALFISRVISSPISSALVSAQRIAGGDLTQPIVSTHRDEAGLMLTALSDMQNSLKSTIGQISSAADQLASAAEELNAVTEEGSRGLMRQNDEIQLAATAVTEMTAAVEEVARNAMSTSDASKRTSTEAATGRDQARDAVSAINNVSAEISSSTSMVEELAGRVREIGQVLDVIRGIAEQTNLLALNAAIEAARAGEQGRGFAVVADEVRALAARTQASTGEIETMIGSVQASADQAVRAMGNSRTLASNTQSLAQATGQSLERIAQSIAEINDRNMLIATASEEQSHVAREVDRNLINIQDLSTQTAAGAHQTSASSQELSRLAISFNNLVGKFKV